jgi:hypothetical protein
MIDYESFQPNLKALRRIMAALIAAAVITFGIAMFLIMRPLPSPRVTHPARVCTCHGAGACRLHSVKAGN